MFIKKITYLLWVGSGHIKQQPPFFCDFPYYEKIKSSIAESFLKLTLYLQLSQNHFSSAKIKPFLKGKCLWFEQVVTKLGNTTPVF